MLSATSLLSVLSILSSVVAQSNTTVSLDYGTFIGGYNGSTGITSWLGIPYADPPVEDRRWRAPVVPPSKDLGTKNATQFGPTCIVTTLLTSDELPEDSSEDCLFVNVYVPPGANSSSSLPVLFWIHGGGFRNGSPREHTPERLFNTTENPFIYVTIQYRLGTLGFLGGSELTDDGEPNAGLLDQRGAMLWTQKYISAFGGDPSRVTIWGQSAGAGSTMFHLIANGGNNEGLFIQAMGDSPSLSFTPSSRGNTSQEAFDRYATLAGCDIFTSDDVMACLRSTSLETLAVAGNLTSRHYGSTLFKFSPLVDGRFLTERAVSAYEGGRFAQVPVLFGANSGDGTNWSKSSTDPAANTSFPHATSNTEYLFMQGQWPSFPKSTFSSATSLYPISSFNDSHVARTEQAYGDLRYICTAGLITGNMAQAGLPTYQFLYNNPDSGSCHGCELSALFPSDEEDVPLFVDMRKYWTSFVTDGAPSGGAVEWVKAQSTVGDPRMLLDPDSEGIQGISEEDTARCNYWHSQNQELFI